MRDGTIGSNIALSTRWLEYNRLMTQQPDRPRLASHVTRTRFLHIEDSLERKKLRLFMGAYERGQGASSTAFTFLDLDEARVLLSDLSWGKQIDYVSYKGGKDGGGAVTSRVLKIQLKEGKYWIEIQNGPGEMTPAKVVKTSGKPTAVISVPLSVFDARKLAHACLAYIQVWDSRHLLWESGKGEEEGSDQ
jgi:hypothetical protein